MKTTTITYFTKRTRTPVGELTLIASDRGLAAVLWEGDIPKRVRLQPQGEDPDNAILVEAERQLKSYFDGKLKVFSVPFDFQGTDFQKNVWKALLTIPFGETRTYSDIAKQIGRPAASRAVGAANGKNPISIMAPCHRVVGSNGELTGFAGGLDTKELRFRQPLLKNGEEPHDLVGKGPHERRRRILRKQRDGCEPADSGTGARHGPEKPLQRVGPCPSARWQKHAGLLGQVDQDRAGFEDGRAAVRTAGVHDGGDLVVGRYAQEVRRPLLAPS
jgi:methylated-DNA-[protein]-cysteine S-methyltransferase